MINTLLLPHKAISLMKRDFSTCIHNPLPFSCHFINQEMIAQSLKLQAKVG